MKIVTSLLLILLLFSCGETETRLVKGKFNNGLDSVVRYYKRNADSVTYREEQYYKTGGKYLVGNIKKGLRDGTWTWWYENGNRFSQCKYDSGIIVDSLITWYKSGKVSNIVIAPGLKFKEFSCINCNGKSIDYWKNGNPKDEYTFRNEKLQDSNKVWYKNGQLRSYIVYKVGKKEGISESFYENGIRQNKASYHNGLPDGDSSNWDISGKLISTFTFKDGVRVAIK